MGSAHLAMKLIDRILNKNSSPKMLPLTIGINKPTSIPITHLRLSTPSAYLRTVLALNMVVADTDVAIFDVRMKQILAPNRECRKGFTITEARASDLASYLESLVGTHRDKPLFIFAGEVKPTGEEDDDRTIKAAARLIADKANNIFFVNTYLYPSQGPAHLVLSERLITPAHKTDTVTIQLVENLRGCLPQVQGLDAQYLARRAVELSYDSPVTGEKECFDFVLDEAVTSMLIERFAPSVLPVR